MLYYDKIDISEGIDINKASASNISYHQLQYALINDKNINLNQAF